MSDVVVYLPAGVHVESLLTFVSTKKFVIVAVPPMSQRRPPAPISANICSSTLYIPLEATVTLKAVSPNVSSLVYVTVLARYDRSTSEVVRALTLAADAEALLLGTCYSLQINGLSTVGCRDDVNIILDRRIFRGGEEHYLFICKLESVARV